MRLLCQSVCLTKCMQKCDECGLSCGLWSTLCHVKCAEHSVQLRALPANKPRDAREFTGTSAAMLSYFPLWPKVDIWWSEYLSRGSSPPQSQTFCNLSPSSCWIASCFHLTTLIPSPSTLFPIMEYKITPCLLLSSLYHTLPLLSVSSQFNKMTPPLSVHTFSFVALLSHTWPSSIPIRWAHSVYHAHIYTPQDFLNWAQCAVSQPEQHIVYTCMYRGNAEVSSFCLLRHCNWGCFFIL